MNATEDSASPQAAHRPIRPKLGAREAAAFLGVSASMLNKLRCSGGGPIFCKIGRRCVYDLGDLENWVASRKHQHTSEYPPTQI
jgi:hypothetical protein